MHHRSSNSQHFGTANPYTLEVADLVGYYLCVNGNYLLNTSSNHKSRKQYASIALITPSSDYGYLRTARSVVGCALATNSGSSLANGDTLDPAFQH